MILALLAGCPAGPDSPVDVRITNLPDGEHVVLRTPDLLVPASSEGMWCAYQTWHGGDVGITGYQRVQSPWGHHLRLLRVPDDAPADGTIIDCTAADVLPIDEAFPVFFPSADEMGGIDNRLPEGLASALDEGQRIVLEDHVVNTSGEALWVSDVLLLEVLPADEVETWVSPWVAALETFVLPPAQATDASFDCPVAEELSLLFVRGHEHEWGAGVSVDVVDSADEATRLYDSGGWTAAWRDLPPTAHFWDEPILVPPGSSLRTSCSWFNDTDAPLRYPAEMCESAGMRVGREPWVCRS